MSGLVEDIAANFALLSLRFPDNPPEEPAVYLIVEANVPAMRRPDKKQQE
jgi:hypothetical protein